MLSADCQAISFKIESMKRTFVLFGLLFIVSVTANYTRGFWYPYYIMIKGKRTVSDVVRKIGPEQEIILTSKFSEAGLKFPPEKAALITYKDIRKMEVWGRDDGEWRFVEDLEVKGASGVLGPKLREGDRQVPEGKYEIVGLNPNSSYHLSMKLNFPNAFDLKWANMEGRHEPGSDIFIHGKTGSIGCLAMGDEAIERLFILVQKTGKENVTVVISPTDPRVNQLQPPPGAPPWVSELYNNIENEVRNVIGT